MQRHRIVRWLTWGLLLWAGHALVVALLPDCPTMYRWYHTSPEWRWLLQAEVEACEGIQ